MLVLYQRLYSCVSTLIFALKGLGIVFSFALQGNITAAESPLNEGRPRALEALSALCVCVCWVVLCVCWVVLCVFVGLYCVACVLGCIVCDCIISYCVCWVVFVQLCVWYVPVCCCWALLCALCVWICIMCTQGDTETVEK